MIDGKIIVRGQRSIYIEELDQTITERDVNNNTVHYITGFMNEKELGRFSDKYPEYSNLVDNIFISCSKSHWEK